MQAEAIGLTENSTAFTKLDVPNTRCGKTVEKVREEYRSDDDTEDLTNLPHHEQVHSTQKNVQKHIVSLSETMKLVGNLFLDDFEHLVTLDSRNCVDNSVAPTMSSLEETGKKEYRGSVKKVLLERTTSVLDTIKINSLALFQDSSVKGITK